MSSKNIGIANTLNSQKEMGHLKYGEIKGEEKYLILNLPAELTRYKKLYYDAKHACNEKDEYIQILEINADIKKGKKEFYEYNSKKCCKYIYRLMKVVNDYNKMTHNESLCEEPLPPCVSKMETPTEATKQPLKPVISSLNPIKCIKYAHSIDENSATTIVDLSVDNDKPDSPAIQKYAYNSCNDSPVKDLLWPRRIYESSNILISDDNVNDNAMSIGSEAIAAKLSVISCRKKLDLSGDTEVINCDLLANKEKKITPKTMIQGFDSRGIINPKPIHCKFKTDQVKTMKKDKIVTFSKRCHNASLDNYIDLSVNDDEQESNDKESVSVENEKPNSILITPIKDAGTIVNNYEETNKLKLLSCPILKRKMKKDIKNDSNKGNNYDKTFMEKVESTAKKSPPRKQILRSERKANGIPERKSTLRSRRK